MNIRTVVLLTVALAVAGLTALLVNGLLSAQKVAVQVQAPAPATPRRRLPRSWSPRRRCRREPSSSRTRWSGGRGRRKV